MNVKEYIEYLRSTHKKLTQVIDRFNAVSDLFSPESVAACFEISPEQSVNDIIEANRNLISDSIIKVDNFRIMILDQMEEMAKIYPQSLNLPQVPLKAINESVEYAEQGVGALEKQTVPLKQYLESTIYVSDSLTPKNSEKTFDNINSRFLN